MSDIPDAIGAAATGAALARAVEPKHGESGGIPLDHGHFAESSCLNCGTPLDGHFCKQCGQAAHLHRTLGAFLHDLAHGVLHLDGKTWRTLPMLAWRPGELTRRYIAGERARYVSPMAIFLFSVFFMFAVFQLAGITMPTELGVPTEGTVEAVGNAQDAMKEKLDAERDQLEKMAPDDPDRAALEQQISDDTQALEVLKATTKTVLAESEDGNVKLTAEPTGWAPLDIGINKATENPGLMLYKLQSNSYKFSWLLIPLSLPFVWLIFAWRRRFGLYDHSVFITYSIAFMSLLFIALTLLAQLGIGTGWIVTLGTTIPIYHIYRHLRGAYELKRFSAIWRTVVLSFVIFIVLSLFLTLLMLLGTFG